MRYTRAGDIERNPLAEPWKGSHYVMNLKRPLLALVTVSLGVAAGCAATAGAAPTPSSPAGQSGAGQAAVSAPGQANGCEGPLDILLTNDDGWDAPGITAMREALVKAGHNVTLVAPLTGQSSQGGAAASRGTLDVKEQQPGVWSVSGTPVDSVRVGLQVILVDKTPDLVVSGSNSGHNVGDSTIVSSSGTVAAAFAAAHYGDEGIPSIDVSTEILLSEVNDNPRFPSTLAAFPDTADFTARLIDQLQQNCKHGRLLPANQQLHVTYPAEARANIKGVAMTTLSPVGGIGFTFTGEPNLVADGGGTVTIGQEVHDPIYKDSDASALRDNKIAITVFDGDIGADKGATQQIGASLRGLTP